MIGAADGSIIAVIITHHIASSSSRGDDDVPFIDPAELMQAPDKVHAQANPTSVATAEITMAR